MESEKSRGARAGDKTLEMNSRIHALGCMCRKEYVRAMYSSAVLFMQRECHLSPSHSPGVRSTAGKTGQYTVPHASSAASSFQGVQCAPRTYAGKEGFDVLPARNLPEGLRQPARHRMFPTARPSGSVSSSASSSSSSVTRHGAPAPLQPHGQIRARFSLLVERKFWVLFHIPVFRIFIRSLQARQVGEP